MLLLVEPPDLLGFRRLSRSPASKGHRHLLPSCSYRLSANNFEYRQFKRHYSAGPFGAQPPKTPLGHPRVARHRPLLARGDGGSPQRAAAAAAVARSKAWRVNARPGHATQDGLGCASRWLKESVGSRASRKTLVL
jgi:hypothetical protein